MNMVSNGRTFDRDIEDIRLFLSEIYSVDEVVFDKQTKAYYLTGEKSGYIDRMEAAVISKILLESAALREDEMLGLLQTVLSTVSSSDAKAIKCMQICLKAVGKGVVSVCKSAWNGIKSAGNKIKNFLFG